MHNTFDIKQVGDKYEATSHNFRGVVGVGRTEAEAIKTMDNAIKYIKDNEPKRFKKSFEERKKRKVTCLCGYVAPDVYIGV